MREILFRGKQTTSSEWSYGYTYSDGKKTYIAYEGEKDCIIHEVIPSTVGQYTGLNDRNGTRVFEGNIIKAGEQKFIVKFGKCGGVENIDEDVGYIGFYITPVNVKYADTYRTDILFWISTYGVEVIGNIHNNPELLETN